MATFTFCDAPTTRIGRRLIKRDSARRDNPAIALVRPVIDDENVSVRELHRPRVAEVRALPVASHDKLLCLVNVRALCIEDSRPNSIRRMTVTIR